MWSRSIKARDVSGIDDDIKLYSKIAYTDANHKFTRAKNCTTIDERTWLH